MAKFKSKSSGKKIIYSGWTILILVIVLLVISRSTWSVFQKERDTRNNLEGILVEKTELEDRRDLLVEEIRKFSSQKGVEEEVREKFRVVKVGEKMIMIIEGPGSFSDEDNKEISIWRKLINSF